eukprot:4288412-Amphidinium_carterae.2
MSHSVNNVTWIHATSALTIHYSTIYYTTQHGFSADIYDTVMERLHTKKIGNELTINPSSVIRHLWREVHARKRNRLDYRENSKSTEIYYSR